MLEALPLRILLKVHEEKENSAEAQGAPSLLVRFPNSPCPRLSPFFCPSLPLAAL